MLIIIYTENNFSSVKDNSYETFVWILKHVSRSITWSLFTLKASNLVEWLLSTWSFMWWSRNSYLDCFFQTILFSAKIIRNRYTVKCSCLKWQVCLFFLGETLITLGSGTYLYMRVPRLPPLAIYHLLSNMKGFSQGTVC